MTEILSVEEFRKMKKSKNYQALGRLKAGTMNGLEKRYAALLDHKMAVGEILDYWFEAMNLRLAPSCFYKIDFLVLTKNMALEVHETKGVWTDDALVKVKVAADKFPFRFIALQWIKKEWVVREF